MQKNGEEETSYYYEFNLQGDIIGTMAESIGRKNPLRYRGYYYDEETGFYYLLSRYYDLIR